MGKRAFAAVAAALCVLFALSGCGGCLRLTGNDRSDASFRLPAQTQEAEYYLLDENIYAVDYLKREKETGEFSLERVPPAEGSDGPSPGAEYVSIEYGENWTADDGTVYTTPALPEVMDTGRWNWGNDLLVPEYEPLYALLQEKYLGTVKFLRCYAALFSDGIAYGYCQGYSKGISFSGGRCAVEEIAFSVHFSYDAATDEYTELGVYDGCNIVACWTESVVYCRDNKYYFCDGGEETYLCDDEAYDNGPTRYSHAFFYYNEEYALLYFKRRLYTNTNEYDYIAVCDASGNLLFDYRNDEPLTKLTERVGSQDEG